ncbi:MAG: polyprenol monophosphomannose synthase [bacterium]|nr:polyprenol monophosphomannose synthase [bacterium]
MLYVVVPTYNEKDNLPVLAEKIFALKIPDLRLMVVDDNSPDGTGRIADELRNKYASAGSASSPQAGSAQVPITVIHRSEKSGLGTAYVTAFKYILSQDPHISGSPISHYVIQMDADLSHDPAVIPAMLEKIKTYDLVLGSRYIPGGKIENWDPFRRFISRFGNICARIVLGLPYHDLTGGFKCFRHELLQKINLNKLSSVGYNFQLETTYQAHKLGARIVEIPITFTERKIGASKFNIGIIIESALKGILMRLKELASGLFGKR